MSSKIRIANDHMPSGPIRSQYEKHMEVQPVRKPAENQNPVTTDTHTDNASQGGNKQRGN